MITLGRNVEIKARCSDLAVARHRAKALGARFVGVLEQTDTYFRAQLGRLKLREFTDRPAELIAYHRGDATEPRPSVFHRVEVPEPELLKQVLAASLGQLGVVIKRRELWMHEQVRLHLDDVQRLGTFLEFEAKIAAANGDAAGAEVVEFLCRHFGVAVTDRVPVSNIDLLLRLETGT